MHYSLFDMAFNSTVVPESVVFAVLVLLAHYAPLYFIVFAFLIVVAVLTTEQISESMDSAETRRYMQYL